MRYRVEPTQYLSVAAGQRRRDPCIESDIGSQGRNHWGVRGGPDPPNIWTDPPNFLHDFLLGGSSATREVGTLKHTMGIWLMQSISILTLTMRRTQQYLSHK